MKNSSKKNKYNFKNFDKNFLILRKTFINKYNQLKNKVKNNKRFIAFKNNINSRYLTTKEFAVISYKFINFKIIPIILNYVENVNNKILNEEGKEFWSVLSSSKKWSSRIIWTLVGVTSFGVVYASFAYIDETIQIVGKLEPKGKTIDVKVPLGGVIKDILVEEGELVKRNQVLLKLDTTAVRANLKALNNIKSQINADIVLSKIQIGDQKEVDKLSKNQKIKLTSLNKEYLSRINASKNSLNQIKFQRESLLETVKSQEEVLEIRENILKDLEDLIDIGGLSKIQFLKEKQELIQLRGRLASLKADLNKLNAALAEAENRLENTIAATTIDFTTRIEENVKQLAQIEKQISEAKVTLNYQQIKSPVEGLVFDLKAETPGYVVNSDRPILKVVPLDDLVGRLFISNSDIAFIEENQKVKIRVDAYPYNEFGELKGKILSIGSDVLEPDDSYNYYRFPVTVELDQPYLLSKGKELPLITGMSLTANVILRKRPIISIFTEKLFPFWDSLEQM